MDLIPHLHKFLDYIVLVMGSTHTVFSSAVGEMLFYDISFKFKMGLNMVLGANDEP